MCFLNKFLGDGILNNTCFSYHEMDSIKVTDTHVSRFKRNVMYAASRDIHAPYICNTSLFRITTGMFGVSVIIKRQR